MFSCLWLLCILYGISYSSDLVEVKVVSSNGRANRSLSTSSLVSLTLLSRLRFLSFSRCSCLLSSFSTACKQETQIQGLKVIEHLSKNTEKIWLQLYLVYRNFYFVGFFLIQTGSIIMYNKCPVYHKCSCII